MFRFLVITLLAIGCESATTTGPELVGLSANSYGEQSGLPSGLTSLSQLSQLPEVGQALALPAKGDQQEVVVQHPQPRRILVRVVKPIIFEERIVIVPYRRVTHEVRPVIEERHTVVYGKDGKQVSTPGAGRAVADAYGSSQLTRTVAEPTYAEPIVRKSGQALNKRTSYAAVGQTQPQSPQSGQSFAPQRESFLRKLSASNNNKRA